MFQADPRLMHDLDDVRRFPLGDDDLIIAGFTKSGTNWMQVVFANLWDDWTTTQNEHKRVPNLAGTDGQENYRGYSACISADSPRLMKTHLPRELMPQRWPDHGKVVHIARNPKDVCISLFYELSALSRAIPDSPQSVEDFSVHVDRFVKGEILYGPFTDNLIGWRTFEHPNLLKISYEDARADIRSVLLEVIDFVGKPVSDERLDEVIRITDFDAMKKSDLSKQINHFGTREEGSENPFMRKGMVGDWKNGMSMAQSELIDREIVKRLEENGVHLTYE